MTSGEGAEELDDPGRTAGQRSGRATPRDYPWVDEGVTPGPGPVRSRTISRLVGLFTTFRASPLLSAEAVRESLRRPARVTDLEPADLRRRLDAALAWLVRAQDCESGAGIARGYSVAWNRYFRARGWQRPYPETTGYIIPTLFLAARVLERPELFERASAAADWEIEVQLRSGAVRGGVIGEPESPAVFNTGQVILGWLAAFQETGEQRFAEAARRACDFLLAIQDSSGEWTRADSRFAASHSTLYNARTAWAVAEGGKILADVRYTRSARRYLMRVVEMQRDNGWIPRCCLDDAERPLLHTLAYAYRGLVEGGRVLEDDRILSAGERGAEALRRRLDERGYLSGRFQPDWRDAAEWACLTGIAQTANVWLRLDELGRVGDWREAAARALRFVASTQRMEAGSAGVRGGIGGSAPFWGGYAPYQVLSWATKFFADAVLRFCFRAADDTRGVEVPDYLWTLP